MRITEQMLVPASVPDFDAELRLCRQCAGTTWFTPQKVMVMSASGARTMRLWTCESHRLPEHITDIPEEQS